MHLIQPLGGPRLFVGRTLEVIRKMPHVVVLVETSPDFNSSTSFWRG